MLYLSKDKKTEYVIVIRKDHSASEKTAAEELAAYLLKITGAEFPIVTDDAPKADKEIVIGFCDRPGCKAQKKLGTDGFTIKTDKENLGDALIEHNLVEGEQGAYGLYIKKVNGITADYDVDKHYWSISKDGTALMTGADGETIVGGEHYEITRAK